MGRAVPPPPHDAPCNRLPAPAGATTNMRKVEHRLPVRLVGAPGRSENRRTRADAERPRMHALVHGRGAGANALREAARALDGKSGARSSLCS
eukprot:ctg_1908.g346